MKMIIVKNERLSTPLRMISILPEKSPKGRYTFLYYSKCGINESSDNTKAQVLNNQNETYHVRGASKDFACKYYNSPC